MVKCSIELPAALVRKIWQEAQAAAPRECCGLIEGTRDGGFFRIIALHPTRNLAEDIDRFDIDPSDHFAASKLARDHGHTIIGCYHSHPGGRAEPSVYDLKGANEVNFLWLIAAGEQLAAFVYSCGGFVAGDWTMSSG